MRKLRLNTSVSDTEVMAELILKIYLSTNVQGFHVDDHNRLRSGGKHYQRTLLSRLNSVIILVPRGDCCTAARWETGCPWNKCKEVTRRDV